MKPCFNLEREPVFHRGCGGRVWKRPAAEKWECGRCPMYWRFHIVNDWATDDVNARFYLEFEPEGDTQVLVEMEVGKKTFTTMIDATKFDEKIHKKVSLK